MGVVDMTASEMLRKASTLIKPDMSLYDGIDRLRMVVGAKQGSSYPEELLNIVNDLADKIDAELSEARAEGISEGVDASLRQGAMAWAKVNGWPDFRDGEDFGAWLERCAYKKPVDDCNEPVQFGDEIELHYRAGGMEKGRLQGFYANKSPVMILSFVKANTTQERRYDTECDVLKRPAPEVLGADGKPIRPGDVLYGTYGDKKPEVKSVHKAGEANAFGRVVSDDFVCYSDSYKNGLAWDYAHSLTHEKLVLAADGKPVKAGETVWLTVEDIKGTVKSIGADSTVYVDWSDGRWSPSVLSAHLTHEKPDTQESIDEDATLEPGYYCPGCGAKVIGD